jgi:tetratricopeptide (TPR) repeat protein
MIKTFTLTIFIALAFCSGFAQSNHSIDSLKQKLTVAKQDTNRVNILIALTESYAFRYPDSALAYSKKGLQLARELEFKTGEILLMINTGFAFGFKGDFAQSLSTILNALPLAESMGNTNLIVKTKDAIGWSYSESGNHRKSLDYYYQVFDYEKENESIYAFMGYDFLNLNKIDSAQIYAEQGYALQVKNKTKKISLLNDLMADISLAKGKYREAIQYIYPSTLSEDYGIDYLTGCDHIAWIYFQIDQPDSAILYAKKVINIKQDASIIPKVLEASELLTEIYTSKKKNIDSAFKYQGMMLGAKDSLFSEEKVKALQNIEYKEAQRQQDIVATEAAIINRVRIYILIGIAFVFLLFGIIILRNYRKQKKANEQIQKTLTELKSTQTQLIQSEKMASLGELTAGIAHEIQNPLNFVNNFSDVNKELVDELQTELRSGNAEEAIAISNDIKDNEQKINHHASVQMR